jgi:hypothetical protein
MKGLIVVIGCMLSFYIIAFTLGKAALFCAIGGLCVGAILEKLDHGGVP